ncbi:MAG: double-strand break repair helicase AddA [Pseudomonadota bacterium]
MSRKPDIPPATRRAQERASDPRSSAWVAANAGSGKTFVLARRVLCLLLDGNDPSTLLCLTFTKAAATEMSTRVFDELARWTTLDDQTLAATLCELMPDQWVSKKRLETARCLFAKALETPGGLRIQTIHAFCESLLHQFPLEAGVPASFQVLDEQQTQLFMATARDEVFGRASRGHDASLSNAFDAVLGRLSETSLAAAIDEHLAHRHKILATDSDGERTSPALYDRLLALHASMLGLNEADVEASAARLADPHLIASIFHDDALGAFDPGSLSPSQTELRQLGQLQKSIAGPDAKARKSAFTELLFDARGKPRGLSKSFGKTKQHWPDLVPELQSAQELAGNLQAHIDYASLTRLAVEAIEIFERKKSERGMLDFDDLIAKTAALLTRAEAREWVRFKMDQRVGHVLVDEAQDTSPVQWQIIMALAEEFFAGEGRDHQRPPTFFAVGDEKQSIYSFQGADPIWFDGTRRAIETKAVAAQAPIHTRVPLTLSFRSTPDILAAVDKVFETKDALRGVSTDAGLVHEPLRQSAGLVEIWPVIVGPAQEEPEDWTQPVDALPAPHLMLADAIASRIARMISDGKDPGDILILMRRRGALLNALTRALKTAGVPIAGTDRMQLTDHIAVEDLIVLMQVMLLPEDDLALATLLKSPLVGLDDVQLEQLCVDREGSLMDAISSRPANAELERLGRQLQAWQALACASSPYDFLAHILWIQEGEKRMMARLGEECREPIDELMRIAKAFSATRDGRALGLQGFVQMLLSSQTIVRRDMDARADQVRMMTVHGAKGLEASTVFLVDTCTLPEKPKGVVALATQTHDQLSNQGEPPLLYLRGDVHAPSYAVHRDRLHNRQMEEYRRLLYVAMTRPRDQLIVTGHVSASKGAPAEGSWYDLIRSALEPDARPVEPLHPVSEAPILVWRRSPWAEQRSTEEMEKSRESRTPSADLGDLRSALQRSASAATVRAPLRPSRAGRDASVRAVDWENVEAIDRTARVANVLRDEETNDALAFGALVHALMEAGEAVSGESALRLTEQLNGHIAPERISRAVQQANSARELLLSTFPQLAKSGSTALSEVPLRGVLRDQFGGIREVAGTLDWLLEAREIIHVIDFKTDSVPPDSNYVATRATGYLDQMAVYSTLLRTVFPGREIRCGLLWTASPRLDWLSPKELDDRLAAMGLNTLPA